MSELQDMEVMEHPSEDVPPEEVSAEEAPAEEAPQVKAPTRDMSGRGKWHGSTSRYIPVGGGSRTRVPVSDDPEVPRYAGNVGMDPDQAEGIHTIAALYTHLGGQPVAMGGKAAKFQREILERKPAQVNHGEDDPLAL